MEQHESPCPPSAEGGSESAYGCTPVEEAPTADCPADTTRTTSSITSATRNVPRKDTDDEATSAPQNDDVYVHMFGFNQDGTCFIAATTAGFRVFTCSPLSEFVRRETGVGQNLWIHGGVTVAAMLYRSHCFAFVTTKEPRRVQFWDDRRSQTLGEIWCRYPILRVLLGREIVAVVTQTSVYLYLAGTITPLSVVATGYNPQGLAALAETSSPSSWRLACPTVTPGALRVQVAEGATPSNNGFVVQAHQSPIGCIALSRTGTVVATASIHGTVIRLFSTTDGWKLQELRLGTIPHTVRCIMFRADSYFVAVSSNSRTIHIFKLASEKATLLSGTASDTEETVFPLRDCVVDGGDTFAAAANRTFPASQIPASPPILSANSVSAYQRLPFSSRRSFSALTVAVMTQSRELVQGTLKSVLPHYFAPIRSFAQLVLPTDPVGEVDIRYDSEKEFEKGHVMDTNFMPRPISLAGSFRFTPGHLTRKPGYAGWNDNGPRCAGPLCAFAGQRSNHFYVIHHDGFLYEARFDTQQGGLCQLLTVTPWFAPRRDFTVEAAVGVLNPAHTLREASLEDKDPDVLFPLSVTTTPAVPASSPKSLADNSHADTCDEEQLASTPSVPTLWQTNVKEGCRDTKDPPTCSDGAWEIC